MRWPHLVASMALVSLAACPRTEPGTQPVSSAASAAQSPSVAPIASARSPRETGGTAEVSIRNVLPGVFEITNDTDTPKSLTLEAMLERRAPDGTWSEEKGLDLGAGYRLVEDCMAKPAPCVPLAPHATLRPAPFKGFSCSSQCNAACRANTWVGPGAFRLTARVCGGATFSGQSFDLPSARSDLALERWGYGVSALRAIAMTLETPTATWKGDEPSAMGKLAGFAVRKDTERALTPAQLKTLVGLLQDPAGFNDDVAKRCAMKDLVGFRLARIPETTGAPREDVVEIAIDRGCNKFFAVRGGDGSRRTIHATHYDPSANAFADLVKSLRL